MDKNRVLNSHKSTISQWGGCGEGGGAEFYYKVCPKIMQSLRGVGNRVWCGVWLSMEGWLVWGLNHVTCHSLSSQSLLKLFLLCWFVCKSMHAQAMVHMWRSENNMLALSVHHIGPAAWTQVTRPDGRHFTCWFFSLAFIPHLLRSTLAMFQFFLVLPILTQVWVLIQARWLHISAFWLNFPDMTPISGWLIASRVKAH